MEIGLQLEALDIHPDLGMGVTKLSFSIDGKVPSSSDCLKREKSWYEMIDFI